MTVVEARQPDGKLIELTEVNLSKTGMFIMITDPDGKQVLVHRYAWDGVVKAVSALFAEQKRLAQEYIAQMKDDE